MFSACFPHVGMSLLVAGAPSAASADARPGPRPSYVAGAHDTHRAARDGQRCIHRPRRPVRTIATLALFGPVLARVFCLFFWFWRCFSPEGEVYLVTDVVFFGEAYGLILNSALLRITPHYSAHAAWCTMLAGCRLVLDLRCCVPGSFSFLFFFFFFFFFFSLPPPSWLGLDSRGPSRCCGRRGRW